MNKKYNTRFTAGISPRKERKPGQVRISEMEEAHNADMRALVVLAAAMYIAIILYHEARWRQSKSDKYEQHNR